ncbi:MAG: NAD-dependent epimerase/dehydratase family protein [Flavobacteriales bacterium]|nr:NAD-dependent epimerase/dehydratase family protein [Flavobacteriales bacterium]NQX96292.1 NAD-dependent epimerase/dehydratase family protein [Flavobacteriales bacterium]
MKTVIITGSGGLIGSEACKFFDQQEFNIVGIDNDMRSYFFGEDASTNWNVKKLQQELSNYTHINIDIRKYEDIEKIFAEYNSDIDLIIHTAAQPSHDWAAKEPFTDFTINANGTLNMLEATRKYCPTATFIFTSTNKVYGDKPNSLPLVELEHRWEVDENHAYFKHGIDENMSIDNSKHSIFGASKVAADIMVQEYGKYFNMNTASFRGGCLTGPAHSGAELHGFLAYLVLCAVNRKPYNIFGHKGKQVRDNIHSKDLINAFWEFHQAPKQGEVYNIGGSRFANISMIEAINMIKDISGHELKYTLLDDARSGDHIWYVSDVRKFQNHYPNFSFEYDMRKTLSEMITAAETK